MTIPPNRDPMTFLVDEFPETHKQKVNVKLIAWLHITCNTWGRLQKIHFEGDQINITWNIKVSWWIKHKDRNLTTDKHVCLRINMMVYFPLSDFTAVVVGRGHSGEDGDVVTASFLWDMLFNRKDISRAVLPLDFRFWGSSWNFTLQQRPVHCGIKNPDVWLWSWSCICEQNMNKAA